MGRKHSAFLIGMAAAFSQTAGADVKAGVDAWSRGDHLTAVREWQQPAAQGDADAQFNLGQAYKLGRGIKQDLAKAEDLFFRAAEAGHLQAADNYGMLLFQRGERSKAMPYLAAAADRGDPRAMYLMGIAHFNGDIVAKDWVRAYALATLARQAALPQAGAAIAQMDQHIPLEQRQQATALASELSEQIQATRARQLAAADLGANISKSIPAGPVVPTMPAANDSPSTAGADYARPRVAPAITPPSASRPPTATSPASSGPWRIQLGAFGIAANAETLWNRVKSLPELAGHARLLVSAGKVTKLQAGGYFSQAEAQTACERLAAAGISCLAVRN